MREPTPRHTEDCWVKASPSLLGSQTRPSEDAPRCRLAARPAREAEGLVRSGWLCRGLPPGGHEPRLRRRFPFWTFLPFHPHPPGWERVKDSECDAARGPGLGWAPQGQLGSMPVVL